ncbi:restriction endonuclease subunit S [Porphyromonas gulae]|uniref:restriction endonuclease subunit S n=1 Tax=Porphyromonas gulae TaxID=111105 RepID=UPI00068B3EC2|nr:restriction endonuclease subunit S [Porphyromonas gulae]
MKAYQAYKNSGISWIGQIPKHWEVKPLGRFFSFGKGLSITKADLTTGGVPVINYGQIHSKNNSGRVISDDLIKYVPAEYLEYSPQSLLQKFDFVFADTSEDLAGAGNYAFNDRDSHIFAGYHTIIARPMGIAHPQYYAFLFQASFWRSCIQSSLNGIKVFSITKTILKRNYLLFPPLAEQEAIVSYLEEKTAKIDRFVSKKEEQILRLKELREAIIAQVVTRGIQPDVALRPSGVSWLGDIPKHWEKRRCKDLLTELKEQVGKNSNEYTLLSLTTNGVIVRDLSEGKGKFPKDFDSYKIVKPDNLVFCLFDVDETPRTVGHVKQTGILTGAYNVFEVRNVNIEYLYHYFISLDDRKALKPLYKGLRKVIPLPTFMAMPIFLPPLAEQEAIVAYITQKTEEIDQLIESYRQEIDRIKELKQGLISDAVLGRINVQTE